MDDDMFGLITTENTTVPLVGVRVEGDILGRGAKVSVVQRYNNQESSAIEAVYKFPLPEGAAICGFKATIDRRVIKGYVEDREKAFEIYDEALSEGHGGYLLDEERPNIFTLSVGNLNPGCEAVIEIEYVILLDMEGPRVRFFLPTTISPRYVPARMDEKDGIPEGSKIHPPYVLDVPYGLSLSLNIRKGHLIKSIECPSRHPVKIEMGPDIARVTLSSDTVKMDRDFILYIDMKDSHGCRAYRYRPKPDDGSTFVQLDFLLGNEGMKALPGPEKVEPGKEILFLLDCSGSMTGDSIMEAKKAVEVCLRALQPGILANVYRFGSTHERFFEEPTIASAGTIERAIRRLGGVEADLGGTEILGPLQEIYSAKAKQGHKRDVILLTDGQLANEEEIIDIARKGRDSTRLFCVGIGSGPNEYFIKALARTSRGACEFIYPGERIEPKALRLFGKVMDDGLDELKISWGAGDFEQAPLLPTVFLGSPTTVFARLTSHSPLPDAKVTLKGKLNGEEHVWEIDVEEAGEGDVSIPLFWAREKIRDLEESSELLEGRGSRQADRKRKEISERILGLSKGYNILSRSASYVAIEERQEKDKTTGQVALRKVPAPVTMGWHGLGSVFGISQVQAIPRVSSYALPSSPPERAKIAVMDIRKRKGIEADRTDLLLSILSLQRPEGGIELNEELSRLIGIDLGEIERIALQIEVNDKTDRLLLLTTAILLQVLEMCFTGMKPIWDGIIQKSKEWLVETTGRGNPGLFGKDLKAWAREFVGEKISS